jgi:hypothetical protein
MSNTEDKNKRPSAYRNPVCTYCKQRHPAPNNENCVMAVIARAEEIPDEVPPTQLPAAMAPNTLAGAGGNPLPRRYTILKGLMMCFMVIRPRVAVTSPQKMILGTHIWRC